MSELSSWQPSPPKTLLLDLHPDSVACTGQFSRLRSSFSSAGSCIMSHLPSDFRIAVTRTLPFCLSKVPLAYFHTLC